MVAEYSGKHLKEHMGCLAPQYCVILSVLRKHLLVGDLLPGKCTGQAPCQLSDLGRRDRAFSWGSPCFDWPRTLIFPLFFILPCSVRKGLKVGGFRGRRGMCIRETVRRKGELGLLPVVPRWESVSACPAILASLHTTDRTNSF